MTEETALKHAIKHYLALKKILWWYNLAGIGAYKGLPDIMALHQGKLYAIEVKSKKGQLSKYQKNFLQEIEKAGGIALIIRNSEDIINAFKSK